MSVQPLRLLPAHGSHLPQIINLIQQAAEWLKSKDTDQWARPWPDPDSLHRRVETALLEHITWICWDNYEPVATITADPREDPHWTADSQAEPAVYVHRLVVSRKYAGNGLGAQLLDWAGRTAQRQHGARWIRISAWTTNSGLHAYYRGCGFRFMGLHPDPDYPSRARFQKSTAGLDPAPPSLFREV